MQKRKLFISDECSPLRTVILGTAASNGPTPLAEEAYDPKSLAHILAGTYPLEEAMISEIAAFEAILKKYRVEVLKPRLLKDTNQLFTRDIGFTIEDKFIIGNILPDREAEIEAIRWILTDIDPKKIHRPPVEAHIEGGDVILWKDYIFIGTYQGPDYAAHITARTNQAGIDFIKTLFPHKKIVTFDLIKSRVDPYCNALHLDCCFQPIGTHQAIAYPGGFRNPQEYAELAALFGENNIFEITAAEMYAMNSNIFSISPQVIVSEENFHRLNDWLREQQYTVETVPYSEIAKQEGLLRCTTLPLWRANE